MGFSPSCLVLHQVFVSNSYTTNTRTIALHYWAKFLSMTLFTVSKTMAMQQQRKSQCVIWFIDTKSVIPLQQSSRREFGGPTPTNKTFVKRFRQFKEKRHVFKEKSTSRPATSETTVELIRSSYVRSPKKIKFRLKRV